MTAKHQQLQAPEPARPSHPAPLGASIPPGRTPSDPPPTASYAHRRDPLRIALAVLAVEVVVVVAAALAGVSYDLRGTLFFALLAVLAVTLDISVALGWNRWPAPVQLIGRFAGIVLISCAGAVVAFVYLNKQEGFYASFSDIWGSAQQKTVAAHYPDNRSNARLDVLATRWQPQARAAARQGRGTVLAVRLWGSRSGIVRDGYVYLPAAYFDQPPSLHFPVMELLPGQPGGPPNYLHQLGLSGLLDREIQARRIPPVIAVLPEATTHSIFTDCVNAVHGEHDETYLTSDVVDDVNATFRTLPGRSWGIAGYSTGGFCAVNLASHHPDRYAAAASLSGYFQPAQDPGTARLYAGSKTALRRNSPDWWVTHTAPVAPPLYVFASGQDPFAIAQEQAFRRLVKLHAPLLPATFDVIPTGGHNFNVWKVGLPKALEFLSNYLPMPLNR
ncbi:MAG TPA: alpha/beta hydrolase-fold protein [Frankiaceae bacterium]|jgi:S-formylglutathione hydrolase FrmB|nr:alpha/beta hydrolase-fold protein [Frankiaceae bacterium]